MHQLLGEHHGVPEVAARAAHLLGIIHAERADGGHAREDLAREDARLVPLQRVGSQLAGDVVAQGAAEEVVLGGEWRLDGHAHLTE